jgi:hypothetical protein
VYEESEVGEAAGGIVGVGRAKKSTPPRHPSQNFRNGGLSHLSSFIAHLLFD